MVVPQRIEYVILNYYPLALQSILALALAGLTTVVAKGVLLRVGEVELQVRKRGVREW